MDSGTGSTMVSDKMKKTEIATVDLAVNEEDRRIKSYMPPISTCTTSFFSSARLTSIKIQIIDLSKNISTKKNKVPYQGEKQQI